MHNHWFTLHHYWSAVAPDLCGGKITQVFTYEKKQCILIILNDRDRWRVDFSGHPELPYAVVQEHLNIPRNKVKLFSGAHGEKISEIAMLPADRILRWRLASGHQLCFEFFGGTPNIYLVNSSGAILDSFKDNRTRTQLAFRSFPGLPYPLPDDLDTRLRQQIDETGEASLGRALSQSLPHWTSTLSTELYYRSGFEPKVHVPELTKPAIEALCDIIREMYRELARPDCYISDDLRPDFSTLPLHHRDQTEWGEPMHIREGYPTYIGMYYRGKRIEQKLEALYKQTGTRIERIQRRIENQKRDLESGGKSDRFQKYGDLLMANAADLTPGTAVQVNDIMNDGGMIEIPLEPELSVIENAQRYYEKAKKSRRGREELEEQIAQSEDDLARLIHYFEGLKSLDSPDELDELESALRPFGISGTSRSGEQQTTERVPYTEYTSPDGWRILVGRSARDNDDLTFHVAHKKDFWFHAENVPGSHVIAVPDNKHIDKPPRETLEYAAALAAGHSQAQHSGLVPVVYTKRKYVTKPRNSGPGAVRYQFETSVIVKPRKN